MTCFNVNTAYFMHSTPAYNKAHKEENSKYNHKYYEEHKEKWQDNDESDEEEGKESASSKSGSEEDDKKDSKDKKSGSSSSGKEKKLPVLNGGSKKGGSPLGKKNKDKKESKEKDSKEKEVDEEKEEEKRKKQEEKETKQKEREEEQERKLAAQEAAAKKKLEEQEKKQNQQAYLERRKKELEEEKKKKTSKSFTVTVRGKSSNKAKSSLNHTAVYVGINSQPYFEHHGRLGMKWGKKNGPPYPLDYSKLSEEERAKDKARVREEGDIESVAYKKNRSYFSDQEINDVINRYQLNTRINQLSADSAKMKAGKSKAEQMAENMAKVADVGFKLSNAVNAGTQVYNNGAKMMNAFGDSGWPIVGQAKPEKNKAEKLSKKELDNVINDLENKLGQYSNKELETMNKRRTMFNQLTSDRDAKREAVRKAEIDRQNEEQKAYVERLMRKAEEDAKFKSGFYRSKG